jgi:mannose-6-phosphate isomerase-like protein (cupin superfamily)
VAVVSGHGVSLRLEQADREPRPAPVAPGFVVTRAGDEAFHRGRAGMEYRDLIPGRLGGRYIASHIRIPDGGPVADWVHHHEVRFQMIFCRAGWARLVYEDQGPSFLIEPGDCVLQPPGIRHRVLEASPGLEVIEIGSPAEHATHADHDLALPTATPNAEREFGGQRFVRHVAADADWQAGPAPGLEFRDTGIAAATRCLADVRVLRTAGGADLELGPERCELRFLYLLNGGATLDGHTLGRDDCCTIPPDASMAIALRPGFEALAVRVWSPPGTP